MVFLGIIFVIIGSFLVIKTAWFRNFFGPIPWFDKHLGYEGGTTFGYKIIGIICIILGFLLIFDMFEGIILSIFRR
jgi:hypothetical protein